MLFRKPRSALPLHDDNHQNVPMDVFVDESATVIEDSRPESPGNQDELYEEVEAFVPLSPTSVLDVCLVMHTGLGKVIHEPDTDEFIRRLAAAAATSKRAVLITRKRERSILDMPQLARLFTKDDPSSASSLQYSDDGSSVGCTDFDDGLFGLSFLAEGFCHGPGDATSDSGSREVS
jgi:hypothetical protein